MTIGKMVYFYHPLGPVKTKRPVAVPEILLSGEAYKRGNTKLREQLG
jgi:hypothetical protein